MDHESVSIMAPKLQDEIWYHGSITRQHAEVLLKHVSYMQCKYFIKLKIIDDFNAFLYDKKVILYLFYTVDICRRKYVFKYHT